MVAAGERIRRAVSALRPWVERLARPWPAAADRFVHFNNDPAGCAARDAAIAGVLFGLAALDPTATPEPDAMRVG
ncbi:MAG: hypothetical protein M0Z49_14465 [Chloroflexi bacterium]|nr:hypothetical protein [Chloroflexota bacterium]